MVENEKNNQNIDKTSFYLIVINSSGNNLHVSINALNGRLIRTFTFGHINITHVDHRKRVVFASEFGGHVGRYFKKLDLYDDNFHIKIKDNDPRCYSFIEGFIKAGGFFNSIQLCSNIPHNGCRLKKEKRL
jgi:ribosomal protein S11